MGGVFLNDGIKKELNRIRPDVKIIRRTGIKGVKYSDIIKHLIQSYKEGKKWRQKNSFTTR